MAATTQNSRNARNRNGSPWRDPDVLHVLLIGALANVVSLGGIYLWFLARTWRTARQVACESAQPVKGAIVLGKRLRGGKPDRDYAWRLRRSLSLLRRHPDLVVVLSGGRNGCPGEPSEAEAGRDWLLRRMPEAAARLSIEVRSADTVDNLRQARGLLPPGPVVLVSNRYHLARCRLLAGHLGLDVHLCAAEPALRIDRRTPAKIVLEAGYYTLFVVGRSWARLIGHRRMLDRVS